MPITQGLNHVALVTEDLDRWLDFYTTVFEAEVVADMTEGELRHALVDVGGGMMLHPFQAPGSPHGTALDAMFERGHLDHLALGVPDEVTLQAVRRRLVERGASDGTITDFGLVRTVAFRDPDGMDAEVARHAPGAPRTYEERIAEPYPAMARP